MKCVHEKTIETYVEWMRVTKRGLLGHKPCSLECQIIDVRVHSYKIVSRTNIIWLFKKPQIDKRNELELNASLSESFITFNGHLGIASTVLINNYQTNLLFIQ